MSYKDDPQKVLPENIVFHRRAQANTTKFWLLSNVCCYDTNGMLHFRWAQANARFLNSQYSVGMDKAQLESDDEQAVRIHLIKQGMIRMNHCARQNQLTIEGCLGSFDKAAERFLRKVVISHPEEISSVRISLFDAAATRCQSYFVNLVGKHETEERLQKWQEIIGERLASRCSSSVIIHVPHASAEIPEKWKDNYLQKPDVLDEELLKLTDWFTDELFTYPGVNYPRVVFPYSRLLVDVERFCDDANEPMAAKGMGVFYTKTTGGEALRTKPTGQKAAQLMSLYRNHQERVTQKLEVALERYGQAVIIDCHSFPQNALPCHDYDSPSDIAYCIGTDDQHTPKWLSDWFMHALSSEQGRVAINQPFRGTYVPTRYYQKDRRVLSIMIEVNRSLYMDEARGTRSGGFLKTQSHLSNVLKQFEQEAWSLKRIEHPNQHKQ